MLQKLLKKYHSLPKQLKASFWFLFCSVLQRGITTITTPIFTRLLTTAEYGNFNVFHSWLNILTVFLTFNLYAGVYTQGLVKFDKDRPVFSSSLMGLTTVMSLVWLAVYLVARDFWNGLFKLTTVQMLAMFVMIWSTAAFQFWSAEQRVEYRYRRLVIITVIVSIVKPLVTITFVLLSEDKVTARILGLALVELIGYTGLYVVQMKRGRQFFSKRYWLYALVFNLPLVPHYLSQMALNTADRIMIREMVSPGAAGVYSLAYSISQIMLLFNTALSQTISPWMYQKIKTKRVQEIGPIMYLSLYVVAAANLLCILVAPEIVAVFAPKTYGEAIWVIPPVAMSVALIFSYDFFARFEFYFEKTRFVMVASVIGAVLNLILNYIFIGVYGYYAAGYTTLFCYFVYIVCHYWNMSRICRKEFPGVKVYDLKRLVVFYAVFVGTGFALMATYRLPVVRYAILAAALVAMVVKRKYIMGKLQKVLKLRRQKAPSAVPAAEAETEAEAELKADSDADLDG